MSFSQLTTPIPVSIIDKGKGLAFAVIDYGPEHNLIWVTALDDSGEIWCAPNPLVRFQANWSMGRSVPNPTARGDPEQSLPDRRHLDAVA